MDTRRRPTEPADGCRSHLPAASRCRFIETYAGDHALILATHLGGPNCDHFHANGDADDDDGWRLDPP